ncbi:carboxypeptidase S [Trichoderma citrinoviride]|uniref:Carboxypeptidase S n=1 Tax=Trichoderma citrinoviride TaxID=58853 RepID=A0A2T4B087_9HYPO|nr:carboxypeptidase S [Trichoderma citrinoviride]PTB62737.1 carboxypeptidase S [Trichoderma citrinoviride]
MAKQILLASILGLSTAYKLSPASSLSRFYNQLPLGFGHNNIDVPRFKCDLGEPLDPSNDGLSSSHEIFSNKKAVDTLVQRHQPLVKINSICYDDLGDFDEDDRWKPFDEIPKVLEDKYPLVSLSYKKAWVETVNRFGLVYTFEGSDPSLRPILLTAHQDVVPVGSETLDLWEHPPFDAYYNKSTGYLYGRGASDNKSAITALMSAMEALLSQEDYNPRRTVIFAFGFDEECSGLRGASSISKHLEERYGENGIAVILDEGGAGLQSVGDVLYALPAVYEKGYLDVWFDIEVVGGHSSTPTPHTSIGMMSEIVVALESNPFQPKIIRDGPIHEALICFTRYSPYALPALTHYIKMGLLDSAAHLLAQVQRETQYLIQTSQAVTWIAGGQKINSLPEYTTLGVNHRYAPQDSIGSIQHRIVNLVQGVAEKYNLTVLAFEGDEDYEDHLRHVPTAKHDRMHTAWEPIYNGKLTLEARKKSYITPQTPTGGAVWDIFAGTVRHTFADQAKTVVPAPGAMTGNTDTRHYLNLSQNIYRWSPGSLKSFSNIHGVNEKLLMSEHVNMAKFYYDFIRNYDQADV